MTTSESVFPSRMLLNSDPDLYCRVFRKVRAICWWEAYDEDFDPAAKRQPLFTEDWRDVR